MSDNQITKQLESESVGRLLLKYAMPAVIGTMVNSLYSVVDRMFIGHLSSMAISGLALTFPILFFLQAFGMLVGVGAAARISIFIGRKDMRMAEKVLGNAFTLTFIFAALTIIPSMIFLEELLILFDGTENTIPYAMEYLYIVIPTNILTSLSFSFNAVMRATGYPRKAMVTMLIGAVLNTILDPIFIFWLDMGIKGAACASVIAMAASALFVMRHFGRKDSLLHFNAKYFKLDMSVVRHIMTIGVSPFSMQLAGSLVYVIMNHSLQTHGGDLALGANGIISSIGLLLVMLVLGIAQGMQPIVGFNYGAGHHDRVMQTLRLSIIIATCIMGVGWACSTLFPGFIVRGFTTDPELIAIAANGLRLNLGIFVVVGSQIVISQFFQSIGVAWKSIFLSLSRQFVYLIPAILTLPQFFGLDGIWYSGFLSDGLAAMTAWLFLLHHIRKLKV